MVDSVVIALMLGLGAYVGAAMAGLAGTLSARGHRIGKPGRVGGIYSAVASLVLALGATEADSDVLPILLMGSTGAVMFGVGLGLGVSDCTQRVRRALE